MRFPRINIIITSFLLALLSATLLGGCSCSDGNAVGKMTFGRVKDKKAYELGASHARVLLENADDEDAVQDALLDVRARRSNIEAKLGSRSAADYELGFIDCIRQNNDSLARIIE